MIIIIWIEIRKSKELEMEKKKWMLRKTSQDSNKQEPTSLNTQDTTTNHFSPKPQSLTAYTWRALSKESTASSLQLQEIKNTFCISFKMNYLS